MHVKAPTMFNSVKALLLRRVIDRQLRKIDLDFTSEVLM